MSDVKITVDDHILQEKLQRLPENVRARIRAVIVRDVPHLASLVRENLSGRILQTRTGKLLNSIKSEMVENPTSIYGRVYSSGVPYAAIQEYGGTTRAHVIQAVNANALHFFIGNSEFFRRSVNHPGSKIPAAGYMKSALAQMRDQIVSDLHGAAKGW